MGIQRLQTPFKTKGFFQGRTTQIFDVDRVSSIGVRRGLKTAVIRPYPNGVDLRGVWDEARAAWRLLTRV